MADERNYVARSPCGCITAICSWRVDRKEVATIVAEWIRRGCDVERMTDEEFRASRFGCSHKEPPKPERLQLTLL
jgi:hypothetical protein